MEIPKYLFGSVKAVYGDCRKRARAWKKSHDFSVFDDPDRMTVEDVVLRRQPNPAGFIVLEKGAFNHEEPGANFYVCAVQDTIVDVMGTLVAEEPRISPAYFEWAEREPWRMAVTLEDSAPRWLSFGPEEGYRRYLRAAWRHWEVLQGMGPRYCWSPMPGDYWKVAHILGHALHKVGVPKDVLSPRANRDFRELLREFAPDVLTATAHE